ncbi:MAG: insulinase family protein, partial [Mariprofundaceae bacterium]|nr:insulinase family protein [Mariprofundaceae bacterium]
GVTFAVSGDITLATLMPMLEARLKMWQGKPRVAVDAIAVPKPQPVVEKKVAMSTSQMLVQFSRLGIARSDVDFFPVLVLNHLLGGGGFASVLMEEIREKRGLVYGVYSYVMPLLARGPFVITLQTRADQADQAIALVQEQLEQLASGHIDLDRLNKTKANLTGGFAQRMDSNRERVGLMGMIGFYNLPLNYLQVWTKRIESVNLADVKRAAKDYLPPEAWNRIQLGPVGEK